MARLAIRATSDTSKREKVTTGDVKVYIAIEHRGDTIGQIVINQQTQGVQVAIENYATNRVKIQNILKG